MFAPKKPGFAHPCQRIECLPESIADKLWQVGLEPSDQASHKYHDQGKDEQDTPYQMDIKYFW